ncbi:MAG: NUDIX hydrolase [Pseudomonadota bacterium]
MADEAARQLITVGVGAVVFRGEEVLLIKRGKPPFEGRWSIPGGRLEFGEALEAAVKREVREETNVEIAVTGLVGVFEALPAVAGAARHMVMVDYLAEWTSGSVQAGDDAADAAFFPYEEALSLLSWDETRRALAMALDLRARQTT